MDLAHDQARFAAAGAHLLIVGQGTPAQSARFRADLDLPFPVLADPDRRAYAAFAVPRGTTREIVSLGAARRLVAALTQGARFGKVIGDAKQLPAAFVVDRRGTIVYARPAQHAGDTPSGDELLAAVRSTHLDAPGDAAAITPRA